MQLSGHLGAVSESDLLGSGSKLVLQISVMGSQGTPAQSLWLAPRSVCLVRLNSSQTLSG